MKQTAERAAFAILHLQESELMPATPPLSDLLVSWDLVEGPVEPLDPPDGGRGATVLIGEWCPPNAHPWDVCLVRTDWVVPAGEALALGADGAPGPPTQEAVCVASGCPALLLVPRTLALPGDDVREEFDRWAATSDRTKASTWRAIEKGARWRRDTAPMGIRTTWRGTKVAAMVSPIRAANRRALRIKLDVACGEQPWMLLLSRALLHAAAVDVGLPPGLEEGVILAAVRGAALERARGVKREAEDATPREEDIRRGVYRLLARDRKKTLVAAFVDGRSKDLAPMSESSVVKDVEQARRRSLRLWTQPHLVPLTFDLREDEPESVDAWATRWLADGRAEVALWLALGDARSGFRWLPDGPAAAASRQPFSFDRWKPRLVAAAQHSYFGRVVKWSPPDEGS